LTLPQGQAVYWLYDDCNCSYKAEVPIVALAERKERIQELMAQETINVQQVQGQPELYVDELLVKYNDLIPVEMDKSLLQFEREMEQLVATFPEHDARPEIVPRLMEYIEKHPEQYRQLMHDYNQGWVQVSAIQILDRKGEKMIAHLANSLIERNRKILQAYPQPPAEATADSPLTAMLGDLTNEKLQAILTPAQLSFLKYVGTAIDTMKAG